MDTEDMWEKISQKYGRKVADGWRKIIQPLIDDEEQTYMYMDNFRFTKAKDSQGRKVYRAIKKRGCCGFYDETHKICGEKYLVGFNYGH